MNIWDILTTGMPDSPHGDCDYWFDGDDILCRTEVKATALFIMLDRLMPETMWIVGRYQPDDDNCECAGWYYISAPGGIK